MSRHSDFMMETRPYGGGYTNFVGIKCGWCDTESWHPARNGGWAMRIFRATGWKVGSKPHQHRCPVCFGKARFARRKVDNPAIPPEIGKKLKEQIIASHLKDDLMNSSTIATSAEVYHGPLEATLAMADPSPPTEPKAAPAAAPAPPVVLRARKGGAAMTPGRTLFNRKENAKRSGETYTGSVDGNAFYVVPLADGWTWKWAADVTSDEKFAWQANRTGRGAPRTHTSKEKKPMAATVTPIRKDPMPTPLEQANQIVSGVKAAPAPNPSREQRGQIHDELTKVYDNVAERYLGGDSDKVVGERLDLPRAWVTEVRAMFFGEHDRNQNMEKQIGALDAAIKLAKTAATRLLEMASEADTLERALVEARKKLEG
jgi:hypothetical protein